MTATPDEETAIAYLRSPLAIRARCENVLDAALADKLAHFSIDLSALPAVVDEVVAVTRQQYPSLQIPVHGRINHFRAGGVDRVARLDRRMQALPKDERSRAWIDLVLVSVLLDAGAGNQWRYREAASNLELGRSEGLAVASLHAFEVGMFSADPSQPFRVDAAALRALEPRALAQAFQVSDKNPLVGIEGRIGLIRALGGALTDAPTIFPGERPGGILDHLIWIAAEKRSPGGSVVPDMSMQIDAPRILAALLEGLGPIWPGRIELAGTNLGDVWRHPYAGGTGPSAGLVPFHKLSQWLAYSLFEPLQRAGHMIAQPGALTGLPEYRNGGLLVDLGVLVPKHDAVRAEVHAPGDEVIVEWRALTVALLDRVAEKVREKLGKSPTELPLANILEGGTWAAGRAVAARLRPDGGSPIQIASDGTVF
ncbi:MAG TPA: URC4/urg3 family protein [Kofleriaceae bacterium]|nr:URC4/urg3 family protein [Kofleriaceae bacterium]